MSPITPPQPADEREAVRAGIQMLTEQIGAIDEQIADLTAQRKSLERLRRASKTKLDKLIALEQDAK